MPDTTTKPREFDIEGRKVRTIRVGSGDAIWSLSDVEESHDPMDRVGGPYRISDLIVDDDGWDLWESGKFFLLVIQDCAFPPVLLVLSRSFENASEAFVNWIADSVSEERPEGRYCMAVTDEKIIASDYTNEDGETESLDFGGGSIGVDTQNVRMTEIPFHSLEA